MSLGLATPALPTPAALRAALAEASKRNWEGAARAVEPAGQVGADIIEWSRLRAGDGRLGDYEAFLKRRPDWPGLAFLREKGEAAVARSETAARVTAYFATAKPATPEGALALVKALRAQGKADAAKSEAVRAWTTMTFTAAAQTAFLAAEGATVKSAHAARLDALLWRNRTDEAVRMLPLVSDGWRRLAEARLALRADAPGVDRLIAAIPADLANHPGLAHARFDWRARKGREDATALLLERSASAKLLGNPDAWAGRRATLARAAMRAGRAGEAYRIASSHHLLSGGDYADLEFLSGFIALRKQNDPVRALAHFRNLAAAVATPISVSRAAYWIGRAEEAAGRKDAARAAYLRAATHQTAYYGLLAAERAGVPLSAALLGKETFPDWKQAPFMRSSVLEAALLLHRAGEAGRARQFFLHLAEGLDATALGQLGDLALSLDSPNLALLIGKQAAAKGIILPRAYFPDTRLIADRLPVDRALALSIARRESEFNPVVVSPAGAKGLMQVMPGTAKLMSTALGLPYSEARLTSDPTYNATLGTGYLAKLIEEFGPALTLVAAGYNAGPGRPRTWVGDFGDPRRDGVDPVDWVEHVPFTETRTYIMRVAESVVIYRARAAGAVGPVQVTGLLAGRVR